MGGEILRGADADGGQLRDLPDFSVRWGRYEKVPGPLALYVRRRGKRFRVPEPAIPPFEIVKQTNADYRKHGGVLDMYYDAGKNNFLSVNVWFTHADRNLPTIMSYQGLGRTEKQKDNDLRVVGRWDKFWRNSAAISLRVSPRAT